MRTRIDWRFSDRNSDSTRNESGMDIDKETYDRIAAEIQSDASPVGIDAKKTHIMILHLLQELTARLERVEKRVNELD